MLAEMTADHSIILPLVVTCTVAYAVRKAIMNDNIYTMKLRARRHPVPEGLHSSVLLSERIRDLMTADFAVVAPGAEAPAGVQFVVHAEGSSIARVTRPSDQTSGPGVAVRHVLLPGHATPLAAVGALWDTKADLIVVSTDPAAGRARDVIGVLSAPTLFRLLKVDEELS